VCTCRLLPPWDVFPTLFHLHSASHHLATCQVLYGLRWRTLSKLIASFFTNSVLRQFIHSLCFAFHRSLNVRNGGCTSSMHHSSMWLVPGYTSRPVSVEFSRIRSAAMGAGASHELFTSQAVVDVHPEVLDQCSRVYRL
jgi:hypothetical protein